MKTRNGPERVSARLRPLTWSLLTMWLLYSAAMLAWYLMNDPEIFNAICRTRP